MAETTSDDVALISTTLAGAEKTTESLAPVLTALQRLASHPESLLEASRKVWIASRDGTCACLCAKYHLTRF
jgi:uncharacterized protein YecT (DUF1311 family)